MFLLISFVCALCVIDAVRLEEIMVDMTYVFDENIKHPVENIFTMNMIFNETIGANRILVENITVATHVGTHMDAPSHFAPDGLKIDQIPITKLIAPAAVINIEKRAARDPATSLTVDDLENWEDITGQSLNGTIVLINSGWGKKWQNREEFLGLKDNCKFPTVSREAAQWLVDNRDINGIGIDTISLDEWNPEDMPAHSIILGRGIYALETVANVDKIPIYGATLHVMPMKIGHATGAPTRIIATFPKIISHYKTPESCI